MIGGQGRCGAIVWTPAPGMAKSIVFVPPVAALESRIAWRSEPGPLSAVVVTRKTPSVIDELGLERRARRPTGHPGSAWCSRGTPAAACRSAPPAPRSAPRAGRCTMSDPVPSPEPARPAVLESVKRPGRDRERQVPRRVERPGIRVAAGRCRRPTRPRRSAAGREPARTDCDGRLQGGPSQGRDLGGVALGVGGRGGDDRQVRRRREGDVEDRLALAVGRHLQRPEVVLGLARAAGP